MVQVDAKRWMTSVAVVTDVSWLAALVTMVMDIDDNRQRGDAARGPDVAAAVVEVSNEPLGFHHYCSTGFERAATRAHPVVWQMMSPSLPDERVDAALPTNALESRRETCHLSQAEPLAACRWWIDSTDNTLPPYNDHCIIYQPNQ